MADDVDARLRKVEIAQADLSARANDFERRVAQVDLSVIWTRRLIVGGIIVAVIDTFAIRWLSG